MNYKYILIDGNPVPEPDLMKWGEWFEHSRDERIVEKTTLPDGSRVSTVFIGLDHNYSEEGPPILFETMVFGDFPDQDDYQQRCSTREQAIEMHWNLVVKLGGERP